MDRSKRGRSLCGR